MLRGAVASEVLGQLPAGDSHRWAVSTAVASSGRADVSSVEAKVRGSGTRRCPGAAM